MTSSTNSKKPLSRHMSFGSKTTQSSETSVPTSVAIKYVDKDRSTTPLRRRQTENSIDGLRQKFAECSSSSRSSLLLPARNKDSSAAAKADEEEKKKTVEDEKPRLFIMEKWLYYGSGEGTPPGDRGDVDGGDEKKVDEDENAEKSSAAAMSNVVEHRRLVETTPIDANHLEVIRRTWPIIADQMNDNGCQIFIRIFELSPGIKRVFGFGREMHGADIVSHPRLVQHASRFMEAMQVAVQHLEELDTIVSPVFINLGKRHIYFKDINADYFNVFSGAILYTWRQALGDRFSADVRSAWSRLFDFIIEHLRFGYELEQGDNEAKSKGDEKTNSSPQQS